MAWWGLPSLFGDSDGGRLNHEKYLFSGKTPKGGYVQRANELLQKHIVNGGYSIERLNPFLDVDTNYFLSFGDSSLEFYIPSDGNIDDIRLVGIKKLYNLEDSLFYANSMLEHHFEIQKRNLERRIFDIKFEIDKTQNLLRIASIKIESSIISAPLISNPLFWKNDVICNTDSIFTNCLFIRLAKVWLPVRNRPETEVLENGNPLTLPPDRDISFFDEKGQLDIITGALVRRESMYRIRLLNNGFIELRKNSDSLELSNINAGNLIIHYLNRPEDTLLVRTGRNINIPLNVGNFEIAFSDGERTGIGTIYCTQTNPFNLLSTVTYHNNRNYRYSIDTSIADLFTDILAKKIPENENYYSETSSTSTQPYNVSTNPILSKYLELEMKQYAHTETTLRTWYDSSTNGKSLKMGIVLMDPLTGEVVSSPWISNTIKSTTPREELTNYNFINHPIGSCFKPLGLFGCYRNFPSLKNLRVTADMSYNLNTPKDSSAQDARILGYPTKSFNTHATNNEDVNLALAKSSNLFVPITFLYAITENQTDHNNRFTNELEERIDASEFPRSLYINDSMCHSSICEVPRHGRERPNLLKLPRLHNSKIDNIYASIFDVSSNELICNDKDIYDLGMWLPSYKANSKVQTSSYQLNYAQLSPHTVSLHFDKFNYNGVGDPDDFRNAVNSWLLGDQNNRWNNVKLCEAFSRVLVGKNVKGKYHIKGNITPDNSLFDQTASIARIVDKDSFAAAHIAILNALNSRNNSAQLENGTWSKLADSVNHIRLPFLTDSLIVMLAKTGTSSDEINILQFENNDVTKPTVPITTRRGMFLFAIMTHSQYNQLLNYIRLGYHAEDLPHHLGIVGVIAIEMTDKDGKKKKDVYYSKQAKDFLSSERLINIISLNAFRFN